jgi:hypothetical protein
VEAKAELERHVWGTFVEGKASVALGGTGIIVSGCEACRKRLGTNSQYLRHLADDVLPIILRKGGCLWGIQRWQGLLPQSEVVLELLNDAVALTGGFFEFPAVQNLHCTSQVFYDSFFLH